MLRLHLKYHWFMLTSTPRVRQKWIKLKDVLWCENPVLINFDISPRKAFTAFRDCCRHLPRETTKSLSSVSFKERYVIPVFSFFVLAKDSNLSSHLKCFFLWWEACHRLDTTRPQAREAWTNILFYDFLKCLRNVANRWISFNRFRFSLSFIRLIKVFSGQRLSSSRKWKSWKRKSDFNGVTYTHPRQFRSAFHMIFES